MQADGTRRSGGTGYDSVYTSSNFVGSDSGTADLSGVGEPATFYVPVSAGLSNSALGKLQNYYRYQILANGQVWRASYPLSANSAAQCDGANARGWRWHTRTQAPPTGLSAAAAPAPFAPRNSYNPPRI